MKLNKSFIPIFTILLGVLLTLFLQTQIPGVVFFSGDAGVKFLLTKQFSEQIWHSDLHIPVESWVSELWNQGLYPFDKPFVYQISNKYFIAYSFPFPLLIAPFYKLWGFRGLYIVPLVSLWLIWLRFAQICHRLKFGYIWTSIALILLIFASPLTLYSAMYWEHLLSVMLAFWGLSVLMINPWEQLKSHQLVLGGTLLGLSAWFRPEFLCVIAAFVTVAIVACNKKMLLERKSLVFITSIFAAVGTLFVLNYLLYNNFLGTHSRQIVDNFYIWVRIKAYFMNLSKMLALLIFYFPIILFPAIELLWAWYNKRKNIFDKKIFVAYSMCIIFIIYLPLILPNDSGGHGGKQWGPRYLLFVIPCVTIITVLIKKSILKNPYFQSQYMRYVGSFLFAGALISGIYINTYLGTNKLIDDYKNRIFPALEFVQASSMKVVVVVDQAISLELAPAFNFNGKVFFRANQYQQVEKLATALRDHGERQFLYIATKEEDLNHKSLPVKVDKLGQFGSYNIFQGTIIN